MPKKSVLLKRILIGLAAVISLVVGLVSMRPNTFHVERSTTIAGPVTSVFAQVNDFHKWVDWSPWENLDRSMKKTFEGAPIGRGSVYSWDGNDDVGAGRMTILESRPDALVRINLEFFRPMEDVCTTEFAFENVDSKTDVTWSMRGKHTFISKAFCMFMDMDKMIGGDFERGLAQLKSVVEIPPAHAGATGEDSAKPQ